MHATKKDILLEGLAGLMIGLLLLPITRNLDYNLPLLSGIMVAISLSFATIAGMYIVRSLARFAPVLMQVAKFVIVGGLNTVIDFGILNLLIYISGIALGFWYILFKSISFACAVTNSYFWNKYWTFESGKKEVREFVEFFVVSLIGFALNVGTAALVANFAVFGGFEPKVMANIGAAAATVLGLAWNFVGYKFVVFKK